MKRPAHISKIRPCLRLLLALLVAASAASCVGGAFVQPDVWPEPERLDSYVAGYPVVRYFGFDGATVDEPRTLFFDVDGHAIEGLRVNGRDYSAEPFYLSNGFLELWIPPLPAGDHRFRLDMTNVRSGVHTRYVFDVLYMEREPEPLPVTDSPVIGVYVWPNYPYGTPYWRH